MQNSLNKQFDLEYKTPYSSIMKSQNEKETIRAEFEKIRKIDASTVMANIDNIAGHGKFQNLEDFFHHIETKVFDAEDRAIYNELLSRKEISYDFRPSKLSRSWAVLAIFSVIKP